MLHSHNRILTTHTGSLPRPPELTALAVRRSRGEEIDPVELETVGKAAVREVVAKQIAAGIDIGNNGEQQRDSFLFYIRDRLRGLGGSWQRRQRADVELLHATSAEVFSLIRKFVRSPGSPNAFLEKLLALRLG